MYPSFEISITWKYSSCNKIIIFNNLIQQRVNEIPRIANTRHTPIPSMRKAHIIHKFNKSSLLIVPSNYLRTRRKWSFDISRYSQALQIRIFAQNTSRKHHTWVRGIRARRNSSYKYLSMSKSILMSFQFERNFQICLICGYTETFERNRSFT